jgi:DNA invertase Pin-like site-specific DNA recombinase
VVVYSRYSTDRQDARSIDDQVRSCRQFAVARGYEIVGEYADAAISGAHTERQNLQRLLADARRGAFRHVLVDDLSRLSRDLGDALGVSCSATLLPTTSAWSTSPAGSRPKRKARA